MTLLTRPGPGSGADDPAVAAAAGGGNPDRRARWRKRLTPWLPVVLGAGAAAASLGLVLALALLSWGTASHGSGSAGQALGVGAALWLWAGGARFTVSGVRVEFLPLLLLAVPALPAYVTVHRVARATGASSGWFAGVVPSSLARRLGLWWIGYALVAGAAVAATWAGPARVVLWTIPGPLVLLPVLVAAVVVGRQVRVGEVRLGPRLTGLQVPVVVERALGPAVRGAGLFLGVGALVVLLAVAAHWGQVRAVHDGLHAGGAGGVLVSLLQVAAWPNLAIWAVSFLVGPGFAVVDGASVTWSGAQSGVLPLVPVFGALPQPQSFGWFMVLVVLVPVACGAVIGRWALAGIARLSSVRTKVEVAIASAVGAAAGVGIVGLVGGSSLGTYRLSAMGAPLGWLVLTLSVEAGLGAVAHVLRDAWRLRR